MQRKRVNLSMENNHRNIVFYDGDCGFCNRTVQFILKFERQSELFFAPLQSEFAIDFFKRNNSPEPDLSTFYFYSDYLLLSKSTAVLAILPFLKVPFLIFNIARIIPICQRDKIYDFIAKRRKKLSSEFCILLTENQKTRFL